MNHSETQAACEAILRRLDDYIDRELSPSDMRMVERHIEDCLHCAGRFRFEMSLIRELRNRLRRIAMPGDLPPGSGCGWKRRDGGRWHPSAARDLAGDGRTRPEKIPHCARDDSARLPTCAQRQNGTLSDPWRCIGSKPQIPRIETRASAVASGGTSWPEQKPSVSRRTRVAERNWKRWGPYLAERQWGTVREDYSADGNVWEYFSHDQARSRAYRWGEDGLLGITDRQGRLCFALALWNGRDPILKERLFGLTGPEGNHGEDVKEAYFYLDSTPTHSYLKALYKYPQAEFPYEQLVRANRERGKAEPEFELADTGVFDDQRYFDVFAEYAKADADDILIRITVANRGPEAATLHLLPTLWFRNTWSWGRDGEGYWPRPSIRRSGPAGMVADHMGLGRYTLDADAPRRVLPRSSSSPRTRPTSAGSSAAPNPQPYVKDAFHRAIVEGDGSAVNPAGEGTKAAFHYVLTVPAGGERVVRLRLRQAAGTPSAPFGPGVRPGVPGPDRGGGRVLRRAHPRGATAEERRVLRQGYAGLLWSKQFYHYVIAGLARGRPQPAGAADRAHRTGATPTGRTCTTATSSRCRTSGSIPGSPPGTSPFT